MNKLRTTGSDRRAPRWPGVSLLLLTVGVLAGAGLLQAADLSADAAAQIEIAAYAFDRGNAKTFTSSWADAEPMVANGGQLPIVVEYDIEFPVEATYTIHIRFAAQAARPVNLFLDDKKLGTCCRIR